MNKQEGDALAADSELAADVPVEAIKKEHEIIEKSEVTENEPQA